MADDVETVRGELDKWFKILRKQAKVGVVTYSDKPRLLLRPTVHAIIYCKRLVQADTPGRSRASV